jgi:hypothetical protein
MSLINECIRSKAGDDRSLQVFKDFYINANADQRIKLAEYIRAIAALSPQENDDNVRFHGEIGCSGDRFLSVIVTCSFLPDGPKASVDPQLLCQAIETWEKGELFAPEGI